MNPSQTLKYILENYGKSIITDHRRFEALIYDLCTEKKYKQEINLLLLALRAKVPHELFQYKKTEPLTESALTKKMIQEYGIKTELALNAVDTWSSIIYKNNELVHPTLDIGNLKKLAIAGDKDKQFILGKAYLKGYIKNNVTKERVEKDFKKAFENFRSASKTGHVEAKNYLGYCYEKGISVERDSQKAKALYDEAAKLGSLHALYNSAICYEYGIGIEQDEKKAAQKYQELNKKKYPEGTYKLAWCYENGIGVKENQKLALQLYQKAATSGLRQAQYYLGQCYLEPPSGKPNFDKAKKWFFLAAQNNHSQARYYWEQLENVND